MEHANVETDDWLLAGFGIGAMVLVMGYALGDWLSVAAFGGLVCASVGVAVVPSLVRRLGGDTWAAFTVPFLLFVTLAGVYLVARLSL